MTLPSWFPRWAKKALVRTFVRFARWRGHEIEVRGTDGRVYGRTKGKRR